MHQTSCPLPVADRPVWLPQAEPSTAFKGPVVDHGADDPWAQEVTAWHAEVVAVAAEVAEELAARW